MRILHITHNPDWFKFHFAELCRLTGSTGETFARSDYRLDANLADARWKENAAYFNSFDAVFVSHLASWARMFLQNGWEKPLYIWLYFRLDHDIPDRDAYIALMKEATTRPNVKFFAATEQDKLYTHSVLGDFPLEVVPPIFCIEQAGKAKIPCGEDKFFLVGKFNEGIFADALEGLGIPIYRQVWTACCPDLRGVRGIVHFPYACNPRSLWENLAIENVYFLPSEPFFHTLRANPSYFWDSFGEPSQPQGWSVTEWYREENKKIFVHYSSFEELKAISDSPGFPDLIAEKKENIREYTLRHNEEALSKWDGIFSPQTV